MLKENYFEVKQKIADACARSKRSTEEITLIAVSKTKPGSMIEEIHALGQMDFGENKVQELTEKYEVLPKDIQWHLIGHLQRNKVKYVVDKACLIHSVDSLRLAEAIQTEAEKKSVIVPILIEVNISGEETKFGVAPEEVLPLLEQISQFRNIQVKGLMTIAPYVTDSEENRALFRDLKKLSVDIKAKNINNIDMEVLSMGMTNDYEIAIEEGATMVRVGTGIFGERNYSKNA